MIINENSPLRNLPAKLNRKQTLCFDGIRYCVEMADLAYSRLQRSLLNLTASCSNPQPEHLEFVAALLDAWSIVDSVHRLRGLLNATPGFKNTNDLIVFKRRTADFEKLRNAVQHLGSEINTIINQGTPVWGVLNWFCITNPESSTGKSCALVAGTIIDTGKDLPIVNPLAKRITPPIDLVTLTASSHSVSLSEALENLRLLTSGIEKALETQVAGLPRAGSDMVVCLDIQFDELEHNETPT